MNNSNETATQNIKTVDYLTTDEKKSIHGLDTYGTSIPYYYFVTDNNKIITFTKCKMSKSKTTNHNIFSFYLWNLISRTYEAPTNMYLSKDRVFNTLQDARDFLFNKIDAQVCAAMKYNGKCDYNAINDTSDTTERAILELKNELLKEVIKTIFY